MAQPQTATARKRKPSYKMDARKIIAYFERQLRIEKRKETAIWAREYKAQKGIRREHKRQERIKRQHEMQDIPLLLATLRPYQILRQVYQGNVVEFFRYMERTIGREEAKDCLYDVLIYDKDDQVRKDIQTHIEEFMG